ncbi:hypothetical protein EMPG_13612 [Blastomyces silverae]|uniref:Protein FYV10 n=1 Tax=Blastomyces silverae TaxID=2060906 RepID=A0A0H1BJ77_9EURO|nr:hypothetical protein EMPG_13612 [Blastomyces silverae]
MTWFLAFQISAKTHPTTTTTAKQYSSWSQSCQPPTQPSAKIPLPPPTCSRLQLSCCSWGSSHGSSESLVRLLPHPTSLRSFIVLLNINLLTAHSTFADVRQSSYQNRPKANQSTYHFTGYTKFSITTKSIANFDLADESPSHTPASAAAGPSNLTTNLESVPTTTTSSTPTGSVTNHSSTPSNPQITHEHIPLSLQSNELPPRLPGLGLHTDRSETVGLGSRPINRRRRRERTPPDQSERAGSRSGNPGTRRHLLEDQGRDRNRDDIPPSPKRRRLAGSNMRPDGGASTSNTNGFSPISISSTSSLRKAHASNSVNGRSPHSSPNGQPQANGSGKSPFSISPTYFGHDREEVTRILIQSLHDLGYNEAASTLSRESGFELESPAVASFRSAVLDGRWADAEDILLGSYYPDRGGNGTGIGGGNIVIRGTDTDLADEPGTLILAEGADRNEMLFCLRQQKFLELLEQRDLGTALMVLRQELTPLNHDIAQLHALSSLLMCPAENLRAQAGWDGSVLQSRQRLLGELSRSISPAVMIPDHRLAVLLDYVKQNQINQCLYHNTAESPSLYSDHQCDRSQFPLRTSLELSEHTDEVWYLEFSHDGTKLATTGRENIVIIYDVATFSVIHRLTDHGGPVAYATWSPDDSKLISCSQDYKARLWDVESGRCILTIDHHHEPVTAAAWAPSGDSFVTGSLDRQSQLCLWSVAGESLYKWSGQYRVRDCSISPDGRRLIAISTEKKIYVYNFETRVEEYSMSIKLDLTCINISRDSRYMLLNTSECEMQLLDIETREVARQYVGQKLPGDDEYIIRNSFGGAAENFVVSGSEDSKIHIWHKENCTLVATLQGHGAGCVNAVSWNPKDPGMFASAGDDRKVRIWTRDPPTRTPVSGKARMLPSNGSARTSALRSTFNRSPNF